MNGIHQDKLVIVTGASRGIGRETVKSLLAHHGCRVIAIARAADALESLRNEAGPVGSRLIALSMDLNLEDATSRVLEAVAGRRVHALVNNAGLLIKTPFGEWTSKDLLRLFEVNVIVPVRLVQALSGAMSGDPPGHVLNIGSMGGFQGSTKFKGLLGYSATKAALANVTECLAEELKDAGIRANCLCLGSVDTEMLRAAFPGYAAPISAATMGGHIARFALEGHDIFNGRVLPVALTTP